MKNYLNNEQLFIGNSIFPVFRESVSFYFEQVFT